MASRRYTGLSGPEYRSAFRLALATRSHQEVKLQAVDNHLLAILTIVLVGAIMLGSPVASVTPGRCPRCLARCAAVTDRKSRRTAAHDVTRQHVFADGFVHKPAGAITCTLPDLTSASEIMLSHRHNGRRGCGCKSQQQSVLRTMLEVKIKCGFCGRRRHRGSITIMPFSPSTNVMLEISGRAPDTFYR